MKKLTLTVITITKEKIKATVRSNPASAAVWSNDIPI